MLAFVETFIAQYGSAFFQLLLAVALGALIGTERSMAHKVAGMRTYGLVSLSACLFALIAVTPSIAFLVATVVDPFHIAASVITGIGFIGAGLMFAQGERVTGLTTAAGLWVAAGVGLAVGFGLYAIAIFTALLTLIVFSLLWSIEERVRSIRTNNGQE